MPQKKNQLMRRKIAWGSHPVLVVAAAFAAAVFAVAAQAQTVNPVADSGAAVAGTASIAIVDVAANDTVNSVPAVLGPSGNATVAQVGTWPPGISLDPSTGNISITAEVPAATYLLQYQLCDLNAPPDCGTVTDSVTVTAVAALIVATPEVGTAAAGTAATPIVGVAANDTVNGVPAVLGASGNATVAVLGSWPAGITLDPTTGNVSTTATVPPGIYSLQYQLCDLNTPPDCASTTDTLTVNAAIVATPDFGSAIAGGASTPIVDVAANDTVNGATATLGTSGNATVAAIGSWPAGITLDPTTGNVSTTATVPPGTYSLQYQLCDLNTPPDCASTTATVTVGASIVASPDAGSAVAGIASTAIVGVAANDTVNGVPAVLGASGNATVAVLGSWPAGITLDPMTGNISTTAAVPSGTYTVQYQLCDLNAPPDCGNATDTITVTVPVIVVVPDTGSAAAGTAATPIVNVAGNDSLSGIPAVLGSAGNATVAALGSWPAGITLDPTSGNVSTAATVPPGTYSLQYQLCDLNTPPDCAAATATVTVTPFVPAINAVPDVGGASAGTASTPITDVAANDTVNGAVALLGATSNATVAEVGTWPPGITLNTSSGAISTTAAVPVGTYQIQYQLCDLRSPPDCATTTDTVSVAASILPVADHGTADAGIGSQPIANVAANDSVNGAAATLGASGNATIARIGTWPTGIGLSTSTGAVSTSATLAAGTYTVQYQLCDRYSPPHCATGSVTITLIVPSIVAVAEVGSGDAGYSSKPIANVAANDSINGSPAILGTAGNASIAQVGTWPSGITLNTTTGVVSTTSAVPAGSYSVEYHVCDKNVPPDCSMTTDTITLAVPVILAVPEAGSAVVGIASTPIANVAANDTINGVAATLGTAGNATVAQVGSWPSGIALNSTTGAVSTTASVAAGTYSIQYNLCDRNATPACNTTTDTVTLTNPAILTAAISGSAVSGIASVAIANIVANDTINAAPATLGAAGNATVAQVGTWPSGVTLNTTTGAVSTTTSAPAGTYSLQYKVCTKTPSSNCITASATLSIASNPVVAIPDSGIADAGIGSKPIANVAANDTVGGAPATLGTAGNATVVQVAVWPAGITLNTSTGSVLTSATVASGNYSMQYKLCSKSPATDCATTSASVTIAAASIVPIADTGSAIVGIASSPIANVAANDTVGGARATLGASGNATVAQVGTWPSGITLNTTTGAVSTTVAVQAGTYTMTYKLCDKNSPPVCASVADTVVVIAPTYTEVQVSPDNLGDIEFDWGRDGVYCATCNFGQGNARFNWTDSSGNLWVGHVDPNTGAFTPPAGNNELVDTAAAYYAAFGNGPEWAFSTQNGQVVSQLVYTRYTPGTSAASNNAAAAFATPVAGGWAANFFPGVLPVNSGGSAATFDPLASQCNGDPFALAYFYDSATPQDIFWEPVATTPGTAPTLTPFGAYSTGVSAGKPAARWVPCTHQLVFVGSAPPVSGTVYQQVFWYDTDTNVVQQLTVDATQHAEVFMFQAPEFNDAYVFYTIVNNLEIDIYQQSGVLSNGAPTFQRVNRITSTDPAEPYIAGTEAFINCTPACQSYIFMRLQSTVPGAISPNVPNGVAVTNINPAQPIFKVLATQTSTPTIQRMDLEYYITPNGPYLYYDRNTINSATTEFQYGGRYYIDMQLGLPSGICVGSSAEDGIVPGC